MYLLCMASEVQEKTNWFETVFFFSNVRDDMHCPWTINLPAVVKVESYGSNFH